VAIFNGDAREQLVSQLWQRIDLKLTPEGMKKALAADIRYTLTFKPTDRVPAHIKVIVYDHVADLIGTAGAAVK
jgi:hypothetical protein